MKSLKDESIDLILTDPPYNVSEDATIIIDNKGNVPREIGMNAEWDKMSSNEYFKLLFGFVDEAYRVLKKSGSLICFISDKYLSYLREYVINKGMVYRQTCVWIKSNPVPQMRKVKFMHATELFFCANKQKGVDSFRWEEGQHANVFYHPIVQGKERLNHPTQKPIWLMKELIRYYTHEGDTVLDPFLGSGTTMEASIILKRNSIGIENNADYIALTTHRLEKHINQKDLSGNIVNFKTINVKEKEGIL
ncbi:MAG: site-specific DNA-methyltransferase [Thermoplasmata archaeon]